MSIPSDEQFRRGWEALRRERAEALGLPDPAREDWVEKHRPAFEKITADAVMDERDRAACLCEALAEIHEKAARDLRTPVQGLIFKHVPLYREKQALYRDVSANSLRTIALLIRDGGDVRKELEPSPEEKIDLSPPAPVKVDGPNHWYPCKHCTDPMDCGSWATCMGNGRSWNT